MPKKGTPSSLVLCHSSEMEKPQKQSWWVSCKSKLLKYDKALTVAIGICSLIFLALEVCKLVLAKNTDERLEEIQTCIFGNCTNMARRFGIHLQKSNCSSGWRNWRSDIFKRPKGYESNCLLADNLLSRPWETRMNDECGILQRRRWI